MTDENLFIILLFLKFRLDGKTRSECSLSEEFCRNAVRTDY
jgi:hypothetical protein